MWPVSTKYFSLYTVLSPWLIGIAKKNRGNILPIDTNCIFPDDKRLSKMSSAHHLLLNANTDYKVQCTRLVKNGGSNIPLLIRFMSWYWDEYHLYKEKNLNQAKSLYQLFQSLPLIWGDACRSKQREAQCGLFCTDGSRNYIKHEGPPLQFYQPHNSFSMLFVSVLPSTN